MLDEFRAKTKSETQNSMTTNSPLPGKDTYAVPDKPERTPRQLCLTGTRQYSVLAPSQPPGADDTYEALVDIQKSTLLRGLDYPLILKPHPPPRSTVPTREITYIPV